MSRRLYVEGGGDSKALRTECRRGFSEFLRKAGLEGRMPRIVASGSRGNAYDSFRTAVSATSSNSGSPMLLVDAEGPVTSAGPWDHLHERDCWVRPQGAGDEQCHLMVQCMESWFLADRLSLAGYFGNGFRESALPGNPAVEAIPKADVLDGIDQAARNTSKGGYSKGEHSFRLLAKVDPSRVTTVSPWASRFVAALREG